MEVIRDYRDRLGYLRRAADLAAFDAMQSARPMRPPGPRLLEEPRTSAAARDAAKAREREKRLELDTERSGE